jgi:hypothetical protein
MCKSFAKQKQNNRLTVTETLLTGALAGRYAAQHSNQHTSTRRAFVRSKRPQTGRNVLCISIYMHGSRMRSESAEESSLFVYTCPKISGYELVHSTTEYHIYNMLHATGSMAAAITTPLDLVKSRLILNARNTAYSRVFVDALRGEGVSIFLGSLVPKIVYVGVNVSDHCAPYCSLSLSLSLSLSFSDPSPRSLNCTLCMHAHKPHACTHILVVF